MSNIAWRPSFPLSVARTSCWSVYGLFARTLASWKIMVVIVRGVDDSEAPIPASLAHLECLEVLACENNLGFQRASHWLMRRALALGAEFIWLLDDDG